MKIKLSNISLLLIGLTCLVCLFNQKKYLVDDNHKGVIRSDVISYYAYLPATFVHKDIGLSFLNNPDTLKRYQKNWRFWPVETGTEKKAIKTSMGNSILYSPFFFTAHILAPKFGYDRTGYAQIYHLAICFSTIFYTLLGLILIKRTLSLFHNELVVSLSLLACFFATNLLYYSVEEYGMSHPNSFFLISLFTYLSFKFLEKPNLKTTVIIGVVSGLIILVRPTNILVALILPIMFMQKNSLKSFFTKWYLWVVMITIGFLTICPQLAYWKYVSGNWLFFSYTDERFYFSDPKIYEGLFSARNGWFAYSPIMLLALIGIPFLKHKGIKLSLIVFTPFIIYLTYSWWCWWYGGSFGSRPMIDFYGIFIIPIAFLISEGLKKTLAFNIATTIIVAFLITQGTWFVIKRHYQSIHYDRMNSRVYWEYMFKRHPDPSYWDKLTKADYNGAKFRENLLHSE